MADQFSETLVERAFQRSGGRCECEKVAHGHSGRCSKILQKVYRGDSTSAYGWEAHSKSGQYLDMVSDIEILCWDPCHIKSI